jgi:hypothetical protein
MKRYIIFQFGEYYPLGGWRDLHSQWDDRETALKLAKQMDGERTSQGSITTQVVDTLTNEVIYGDWE